MNVFSSHEEAGYSTANFTLDEILLMTVRDLELLIWNEIGRKLSRHKAVPLIYTMVVFLFLGHKSRS